jgi:tetratricopeptide (TPR) repeat protein
MRKIFMKKIIAGIVFLVLAGGCSVQKETVTDETNHSGSSESASARIIKARDHFIKGSVYELKGNYASAILEYQDALKLDPDAGIHYALAKSYGAINKIPLALQHSKKSVEMSPGKIEYHELLADIFSSARQYDSAAAVLEKIIEMDPSHINAHYKLARFYEKSRPLKAIEIYNKLTSIIGPEWNVLFRLAELYENLGNTEQAAESIEELLTLDPGNSNIQKLLSEIYTRGENFEEAIRILDDILELTPDDLDARERKAQIYILMDDWEAAGSEYNYILEQPDVLLDLKIRIGASYFARSLKDSTILPLTKKLFETIDRDTTDWQVKMYLGAIAINENKDSVAIQNFKQVTELAGWNVEAWIRLGGLYFDNQYYNEAVLVMTEAIQLFPEDFVVNLILGLSLAQSGNNEEARMYLKKSVDLNPNDITALSAYGFTLNQLKEDEEALSVLNRALEIKPDELNILGTLGLIYNAKEMWEECDSVYERALKIDPENPVINNNYAYSLSERGIRLDAALEMVKISIEKEPENSSYLDTIGWVYYKLGDYEKAKYYLEKAIEYGGDRPVILDHLGDVMYKLGDKNLAMEFWQKAFDLDTSNSEIKNKIEKGEI